VGSIGGMPSILRSQNDNLQSSERNQGHNEYAPGMPDPGIPYRVVVVEINIPMSEKIIGYDATRLESLIDFVSETMEKEKAERAEIYPLSEPDVVYMLPRNVTASPRDAGLMA